MILLGLDDAERAHLIAALRDRERRLRRDGRALPSSLVALADGLARSSADIGGQGLPGPSRAADDRATSMSGGLLVDPAGAARLLGVSLRTLRRRAAAGEVPSVWEGNRRRYRRPDLEAYVAGLRKGDGGIDGEANR